ncbi:MAG TPA: GNAT family N-acetyltransferase [Thermomicrobiales bacterium]|nr:GNAT family N-acetyltransferase [Thermomicrobiales bacterium]
MRPLWLALHQHHRDLGSAPLVADDAASWRARRDLYRALLADDRGFLLGAFAGEKLLGYVAVRLSPGPDDTFPIVDRAAEIYSLVVAVKARGRGVGSLLLDAVDERLAALGIAATSVAAMVENAEAIRLYRRRGFAPREIVLWRFQMSGGDAGEDDA